MYRTLSEQEVDAVSLESQQIAKLSNKAAILLAWKAGKGYCELGNRQKAIGNFKHALSLVLAELKQEDCNSHDGDEGKPSRHRDKRKLVDTRAASRRWKKTYEQLKVKLQTEDTTTPETVPDRTSVSSSSESDDEIKMEQLHSKRNMVLEELLDTEESFVIDMKYITEKVQPLFSLETTSPILKVNTASIFGNILELCKFHCRFLKELKSSISDVSKLGNVFLQNEDYICDIYARYCRGKPAADDLMEENREEIDSLFRTYLRGQRLTLNDYLIKPVQRLMKYQLLLSLVLKYTEKLGESTDSIKKSVHVMKVIPQEANKRMNIAMISDYSKHLSEDALLLQDNFEVSFGRYKNKPRNCRVFLFKDCFIVTEVIERQGRMPQFKFLSEGKTEKMGLTPITHNDKLKFAVWFRKFNSSDIYVCKSDSAETKEAWLNAIRKLVDAHRETDGDDPFEPDFQSSQIRRVQTWTANEFVRRATVGHPRHRGMSGRLKTNIERFLTEEYHMTAATIQETDSLDVKDNSCGSPRLHRHETFGCSRGENVVSDEKEVENSPVSPSSSEYSPRSYDYSPGSNEYSPRASDRTPRIKVRSPAIDDPRCDSPYENVTPDGENSRVYFKWPADRLIRTNSSEKTKRKTGGFVVHENNRINDAGTESSNGCNDEFVGNSETFCNGDQVENADFKNVHNANTPNQNGKDDLVDRDELVGKDDFVGNPMMPACDDDINNNGVPKSHLVEDCNATNRETPVESNASEESRTKPPLLGRGRTISDAAISCWVETVGDSPLHTLCQRSSELLLLRSIESESRYLLAKSMSSDERNCTELQHYAEALALFLPVKKLFAVSMTYATRRDIVTPLSGFYSQLKTHQGYIAKTSKRVDHDECTFFSYNGLTSLLRDFSWATNKVGATKMSIVLATMAVVIATAESDWDDALCLYERLSKLFTQDGHNDCAVDCLIDAYFITLENGDMAVACDALANALRLAMQMSDRETVERIVVLANSLDQSADSTGQLPDLIEEAAVNHKLLAAH